MANNKDARIICSIGPMNQHVAGLIEDVTNCFDKEKVGFFVFSGMTDSSDMGVGGHPRVKKHETMAEELYEYLNAHFDLHISLVEDYHEFRMA